MTDNETTGQLFIDDFLAHYGKKGMQWGKRSTDPSGGKPDKADISAKVRVRDPIDAKTKTVTTKSGLVVPKSVWETIKLDTRSSFKTDGKSSVSRGVTGKERSKLAVRDYREFRAGLFAKEIQNLKDRDKTKSAALLQSYSRVYSVYAYARDGAALVRGANFIADRL